MFEALRNCMKAVRPAAAGGAFLLAALLAGGARATVPEGSLLTNIAFASYQKTDGSARVVTFNATFTVFVKTPNVMIRKTAFPPMQAPGGMVWFCLSFSNASVYTTAFNVVIADQLPDNMSFLTHDPNFDTEFVADPDAVLTPGYTLDGGATWVDGAWLTNGQVGGPLVKMRWAIDGIGPGRSGVLCFRAKVL